MSLGANPATCALSNADANLTFIIPDKQVICIIIASASVAIWHFSNLNLSIARHVQNNVSSSYPSQYLVMRWTWEPLGIVHTIVGQNVTPLTSS